MFTLAGLVGLIIALIVLCLLVYVIRLVVPYLGLPPVVEKLVYVLVAVLFVMAIAYHFGYLR